MTRGGDRKRVLILGGSVFQVPLIEHAKAQGDYVITADYLPSNPGHKISDEYHDVSTTDIPAVVALAERLNIDAVMTFGSDPALPAVSAVAERLKLPGPASDAVALLSDKSKFRALLNACGLPAPRHLSVGSDQLEEQSFQAALGALVRPVIIKPVDSCGSKGISIVLTDDQLAEAFKHALAHSRAGQLIAEEYLEGPQVHGDGFMMNGKLVHCYLGDHYFYTKTGNRIPQATVWPSIQSEQFISEVQWQVELVTARAGYTDGPLNIEARLLVNGKAFLVECAPRNGGNHVPLIQGELSSFDFVGSYYKLASGNRMESRNQPDVLGSGCYFSFYAEIAGVFQGIRLSEYITTCAVRFEVLEQIGDEVIPSRGSGNTLAVLLLRLDRVRSLDEVIELIKAETEIFVEPTTEVADA